MIEPVELLLHDERDSAERSDVVTQPREKCTPASAGELTERQLDLQRRLVRESLLLHPA